MVRIAERRDGRRSEGSPREASEGVEAVAAVLAGVRALFHRLKARAEEAPGRDRLAVWRLGVLRELECRGASSVRDLPRRWPVTGQTLSLLVEDLLDRGMVEYEGSPAHRGSRSVRITDQGRDALHRADRLDAGLIDALPRGLTARELEDAARVLRTLWEALGEG